MPRGQQDGGDPASRIAVPALGDPRVERPRPSPRRCASGEVRPAGAAEFVAVARLEAASVSVSGRNTAASLEHALLQPRHRERASRRPARRGRPAAASGIGEHVDVVADQVLALARRLAVADDRRAEAREDQRAHQPLHDLEVAAPSAPRRSRTAAPRRPASSVERQLAVRRVEQQVRQQPVGLRGGPAQAVAEAGADQARRRGRRGSTRSKNAPTGACAGSEQLVAVLR